MKRHNIKCGIGLVALCLGLAAPAAAQDCKPLRPLASVKMKPDNGLYLLPVKINKTDAYLRLDTTGFNAIYPEALADLKLTAHDYGGKLISSDGSTSTFNTLVDELQLGQITFGTDEYYFVLPEKNPGFASNRIAGTLGIQIINDADMDFDFGNNLFNLFSPDHCDGKVVYWKSNVVAIVPFEFDRSGKVSIKTRLDGEEFIALIDTSTVSSTLNLSIVTSRLGFDPAAPDVENVGRADDPIYRKRFKSLELAGIAINNPQLTVIPDKIKPRMNQAVTGSSVRSDSNRLHDLLLGTGILSKLHIYVATKEHRLYITPASAPPPAAGQ